MRNTKQRLALRIQEGTLHGAHHDRGRFDEDNVCKVSTHLFALESYENTECMGPVQCYLWQIVGRCPFFVSPDCHVQLLVLYSLHVEPDGGDGVDVLSKVELVLYRE